MKPGLHHDFDEATYHREPGLSSTRAPRAMPPRRAWGVFTLRVDTVHVDGFTVHMDSTQMRAAIAKRAFDARKGAGLSQEDMATKTGMAYRTIRRRENGESDFTTGELLAWATATGATFEWLMTGAADEMKASA